MDGEPLPIDSRTSSGHLSPLTAVPTAALVIRAIDQETANA
jgi:hypothetical protein